ncbi:MAG TPA: histidine kinase dimerization/phospho-acceptor domain-containing protein [Pyrinomonadaceae bacterium]|jgi:two-component system sensor histidine kinase BarA
MKECDTSLAMSVGKQDEPVMNGNLDIPHNRVRLDSGVLRKEWLGPDFVRQMNHELRTPLNVIIGLCQYLDRDRDAPLNERQRDTVSRMERNAHALLETVNRLLECVRTGKYE